jgi:hypothetical protein
MVFSAGEHRPREACIGFVGSSPTFGASFIGANEDSPHCRTEYAQNLAEPPNLGYAPRKMKFPVHVKHRKSEAVVYGKTPGYPFYRVAYRAGGKRQIRSFATYTLAREAAEAKVRELDAGNQSAGLSAKEAAGAIAIRDALESFRRETGRKLSPSQIVTEYLHAAKLLGQRPLGEAV